MISHMISHMICHMISHMTHKQRCIRKRRSYMLSSDANKKYTKPLGLS